ncbi:MAG: hypothetical protein LBL61_05040 [Elusimicrobiota bacterium]|jgi:hypothetical protein|nr:hypothetical protein [Elusimicrobiota bacterium]
MKNMLMLVVMILLSSVAAAQMRALPEEGHNKTRLSEEELAAKYNEAIIFSKRDGNIIGKAKNCELVLYEKGRNKKGPIFVAFNIKKAGTTESIQQVLNQSSPGVTEMGSFISISNQTCLYNEQINSEEAISCSSFRRESFSYSFAYPIIIDVLESKCNEEYKRGWIVSTLHTFRKPEDIEHVCLIRRNEMVMTNDVIGQTPKSNIDFQSECVQEINLYDELRTIFAEDPEAEAIFWEEYDKAEFGAYHID